MLLSQGDQSLEHVSLQFFIPSRWNYDVRERTSQKCEGTSLERAREMKERGRGKGRLGNPHPQIHTHAHCLRLSSCLSLLGEVGIDKREARLPKGVEERKTQQECDSMGGRCEVRNPNKTSGDYPLSQFLYFLFAQDIHHNDITMTPCRCQQFVLDRQGREKGYIVAGDFDFESSNFSYIRD